MHTDTHSSPVISDISHFPSCYLQPSVDIPKASRAEPETVEGGSKNSISTQLSVPNMSEHVFNISSLNMHEIKYSRLHCLLSDELLFWNSTPSAQSLKSVVFPVQYRWIMLDWMTRERRDREHTVHTTVIIITQVFHVPILNFLLYKCKHTPFNFCRIWCDFLEITTTLVATITVYLMRQVHDIVYLLSAGRKGATSVSTAVSLVPLNVLIMLWVILNVKRLYSYPTGHTYTHTTPSV